MTYISLNRCYLHHWMKLQLGNKSQWKIWLAFTYELANVRCNLHMHVRMWLMFNTITCLCTRKGPQSYLQIARNFQREGSHISEKSNIWKSFAMVLTILLTMENLQLTRDGFKKKIQCIVSHGREWLNGLLMILNILLMHEQWQ